ncbi:MAG: tRNA dihydrouridine(20/20a) synthase DusA [Alphaproteobacteria bacterium]|nr:tRNA dihydrouridine(20/20a) synthase DusA [Alphaproteobacteria bacterium]
MNATPFDITPVSVAPMMDWTDRHERFFLRQISRRARLYTEMITTGAILHGDRARLLRFNPDEHPVALQIGGADPVALAESARIGADFGYDEINLNIGCPSDRVQSGDFGACLMAKPDVVARAVEAMGAAVDLPVTVKHRIAIDDQDEWPTLTGFVETVANAGCRHFIVHARKAWLTGLSAKENREVPPLRYELVHRLKQEMPALAISINGGFTTLDATAAQLDHVDGVMIGREAYQNPYVMAEVDRRFFGETAAASTRHDIVDRLCPYVEQSVADGVPLKSITRHVLGLFNGQPGARAWRRYLSENAPRFDGGPGDAVALLQNAAALVAEDDRSVAAA